MGEQVSQVFGVAIEQLRETFRLWELSESVVGDERDKILAQREIILAEVVTTSEQLRSVVTQFQELTREDLTADLSTLGAELEATMRVARRTEERIRELDHPTTNTESFIQD